MFQPDEPNGLRNGVILWIVLFVSIYLLISLSRCATDQSLSGYVQADICPFEDWVGITTENAKEFEEHAGYARAGCIRHYGEGACLIRLTYLGERSYHATCRRAK